ncbi:hypothetical protein J2TS4_57320 [Paenibacillus sp. J2TS4]|nr:hypothetical protein J2TS4_57320 [Paenibacillus sp. J2TS4]
MDYTKCFKEVLLQYSFIDPIVEFIRHNENITYKVIHPVIVCFLRSDLIPPFGCCTHH